MTVCRCFPKGSCSGSISVFAGVREINGFFEGKGMDLDDLNY